MLGVVVSEAQRSEEYALRRQRTCPPAGTALPTSSPSSSPHDEVGSTGAAAMTHSDPSIPNPSGHKRTRRRRRPKNKSAWSSTVPATTTPRGTATAVVASSVMSLPSFNPKKPHDAPMTKRDLYFCLRSSVVVVQTPQGYDNNNTAVRRITVLNWENQIVLDRLVKIAPLVMVADDRPKATGITKKNMLAANDGEAIISLDQARTQVGRLLRGKILIGHGLEVDLQALGLSHPWCDVRDTATYAPYMEQQQHHMADRPGPTSTSLLLLPRELSDLASAVLGRSIVNGGGPIQEAITCLDLYKVCRTEWESELTQMMQQKDRQRELVMSMRSGNHRNSKYRLSVPLSAIREDEMAGAVGALNHLIGYNNSNNNSIHYQSGALPVSQHLSYRSSSSSSSSSPLAPADSERGCYSGYPVNNMGPVSASGSTSIPNIVSCASSTMEDETMSQASSFLSPETASSSISSSRFHPGGPFEIENLKVLNEPFLPPPPSSSPPPWAMLWVPGNVDSDQRSNQPKSCCHARLSPRVPRKIPMSPETTTRIWQSPSNSNTTNCNGTGWSSPSQSCSSLNYEERRVSHEQQEPSLYNNSNITGRRSSMEEEELLQHLPSQLLADLDAEVENDERGDCDAVNSSAGSRLCFSYAAPSISNAAKELYSHQEKNQSSATTWFRSHRKAKSSLSHVGGSTGAFRSSNIINGSSCDYAVIAPPFQSTNCGGQDCAVARIVVADPWINDNITNVRSKETGVLTRFCRRSLAGSKKAEISSTTATTCNTTKSHEQYSQQQQQLRSPPPASTLFQATMTSGFGTQEPGDKTWMVNV